MTAAADSYSATTPRTLRVRAEYRRSLLYLAIGGWVLIAVAVLVNKDQLDPWGVTAGIIVAGVAPGVAWVYAITYRLVIDDAGLLRRRLCFWSRWSWDEFAAGRVTFNEKDGLLTNRTRPFWDRWLSLAFLETEGLAFVTQVIRRLCPAESHEELLNSAEPVEQVELTLYLFRTLQISAAGCTGLQSGKLLLWTEIDEWQIERQKNQHGHFYSLHVTAGGRSHSGPITHVRTGRSWSSPRQDAREIWIAQLRDLIPERCFKYYRTDGDLASVEEGEFRLKHLAGQLQVSVWLERFGWAFLVLGAIMFGPKIPGWWNVPLLAFGWKLAGIAILLLLIVQPTVIVVALSRHMRTHLKERLNRTRLQMDELANAPVKPEMGPTVHAA